MARVSALPVQPAAALPAASAMIRPSAETGVPGFRTIGIRAVVAGAHVMKTCKGPVQPRMTEILGILRAPSED